MIGSLALLRVRRERPGCRAAECSQQFPPSDSDCHTPLPREGAFAKIPRHERAVLTGRPSARVGGGTPGTGLNGSPPTLRLAFKSCLLCPRQLLAKRRHRGLAGRLVAVCWRAGSLDAHDAICEFV